MKIKVRDTKGITLVALVVTIVVILILASIVTYSGIEAVNIAKLNRFIAEMKIMQTEVNNLYDKYKNGDTVDTYTGDDILNIGKDVPEEIRSKIFSAETSGITDSTGYRYFDSVTIKALEIEEIEEEFLVNISKRSIISTTGLEYNNNTYYTLEQLPNSLYNVEYNGNTIKPDFNIKSELIGEKKYKITIEPTNNENIQKWEVKYQLDGDSYWNTSDELTFNVEKAGKYNIKIQNGDIESDIKTEYIGYVAEGMVLHYDGIINTRSGSNKSTEINTWEDLSGNRNDASINITENIKWKTDAIRFENTNEIITFPDNIIDTINGRNFTMQFLISDYIYENTEYPTILWSANDNFSFYTNYNDWGFFRFKNNSNNRPDISFEDSIDKIVTIKFDLDSNSLKLYSNAEQKSEASITNTINADNFNIGRTNQNNTFSLKFIRIYKNCLSEDEIKSNYEIDKTRFNIQ